MWVCDAVYPQRSGQKKIPKPKSFGIKYGGRYKTRTCGGLSLCARHPPPVPLEQAQARIWSQASSPSALRKKESLQLNRTVGFLVDDTRLELVAKIQKALKNQCSFGVVVFFAVFFAIAASNAASIFWSAAIRLSVKTCV